MDLFVRLFFLMAFLFMSPTGVSSPQGEWRLLIFENGTPAAGVEVVLDGNKSIVSGYFGEITERLDTGKHTFMIMRNGQEISKTFSIMSGQTTEVVLNIFQKKSDIKLHVPHNELEEQKTHGKEEELGKVTGVIRDFGNRRPLSGVRLFVRGIDVETVTQRDGRYTLSLPPGEHLISFVHPKYATETLDKIRVVSEKTIKQDVSLTPTGLELEDFVVIAPSMEGSAAALIEIRKSISSVADVIGAEQIGKAGDSSAAGSLKRVTGLSLIGGKYIYVRGLGERYSSVLLNNNMIPGPEPMRRVVPLDIFPSGIFQSMMVQKSYSPDMPGEFGGGVINLVTKDPPTQFEAKVSLSLPHSPGSDADIKTYHGGKRDWLGVDDGSRALPTSVAGALRGGRQITEYSPINPQGFSQEELIRFGQDMPKNYNIESGSPEMIPGIGISLGNSYRKGNSKVGFLFSGIYKNKWEQDEKTGYQYVVGESNRLFLDREKKTVTSERKINLGGMLNLELSVGKEHQISTNSLLLRKTTDKVREVVLKDKDDDYRTYGMEWTERQLSGHIIRGTHELPFVKEGVLSWRYSRTKAQRNMPDGREYRYDRDSTGKYKFYTSGKGNERFYADLEDITRDMGGQWEAPLIRGRYKVKLKLGFAQVEKSRESQINRFKYQFDDNKLKEMDADGKILYEQPEAFITNENVHKGIITLTDNTVDTDDYSAWQTLRSVYVDTEWEKENVLRISAGMRREVSIQEVRTYKLFSADGEESRSWLKMEDLLPVYSTTVFLPHNMQVRGAYSETVGRPDFKELSTAPYYDDERGEMVVGNNALEGTIVKNYDLRWEWYLTGKEYLSLGFFMKKFQSPIENVIQSEPRIVTFENMKSADNRGIEIEWAHNLSRYRFFPKGIVLSGNISIIDSLVELDKARAGQLTSSKRPLQGQSPYIINVNLDYVYKKWGIQMNLLYNVFGDRIVEVGTNGAPDIKEDSFHQIDFVWGQEVSKTVNLKFKIKNILNREHSRFQGEKIVQTYRKGRELSLGLVGKF